MSIRTFCLDRGKDFVSGLHWEAVQGGRSVSSKQKRKWIQDTANLYKCDLVVQRTTGVPQVGFATSADGYAAGMLSAAAMMSKSVEILGLGDNVLVAVELPTGNGKEWFYFAQRDGATLPEGDQIGSEDEIQRLLRSDLSLGLDVGYTVIAPSHWRIPDAKEKEFQDFFPSNDNGKGSKKNKAGTHASYKAWWALKPVKQSLLTKKRLAIAGLVAVTAASAAFGLNYYKHQKTLAQLAAYVQAQQKAAAEKAAALASMRAAAPPKVDHPWKSQPRAIPFAQACRAAFFRIQHLYPAGWNFREATCVGNSLAIVWTRPPHGRIDYFNEIQPGAVLTLDHSTATLVVPLKVEINQEENVPVGQKRSTELNDLNQTNDWRMVLSDVVQPPLSVAAAKSKNDKMPAPLADWTEQKWKIPNLGRSVISTLEQMDSDGLRVTSIQTMPTGSVFTWNIEGVQYGKP